MLRLQEIADLANLATRQGGVPLASSPDLLSQLFHASRSKDVGGKSGLKVPQGKVLGTDKSLSMIEFAKENYTNDHLQFELISAENLNFHEQFDWAISFTVFHWIKDAATSLENIYGSLKPGGKLLLEIPFKAVEGVHPLHKAARDVAALPEWKNYFISFDPGWYFRTKEEYEALLQATSFQQVKFKSY